MGSFGPVHWLIIAVVLLLLFGGRGKISDLMGDFAKGINSFRKGLKDHDDDATKSIPQDRRDDVNTTNKDQTVGR